MTVNSHDTVRLSTTKDLENAFLGWLMSFILRKAPSSLSEIKFRILWWYKIKPEIKISKFRKPEMNRKLIYCLDR